MNQQKNQDEKTKEQKKKRKEKKRKRKEMNQDALWVCTTGRFFSWPARLV